MSELTCPVSGTMGGECPMGRKSRRGPRGCAFSGYSQPGDLHAAFDIPNGVDAEEWLRQRERKAINELVYSNVPPMDRIKEMQDVNDMQSLDKLNVDDHDLLALALGAPARQVLLRAEEIGPKTGWRDGYLSTEYGFCPPDCNEAPGALRNSPGRVWSDLCERMPGCVARGRVRESVAALPIVEGTPDIIPDKALWAALVALGMLCSIYRYEEKNNGNEGVNIAPTTTRLNAELCDGLGDEVQGIPKSIGLPYFQISRRMGRSIPHLTFFDQSSYNVTIRDPASKYPYIGRFDNTDLRWPMFDDLAEKAFLKGCADTSASFQHGVDAIASCQEHVMTRNIEGLLREMVRLKEILERMPNAFHSISPNPASGENYTPAAEWVRWAKFSAPLSKRCPATSGLQFPPYLLMDAFLSRAKYQSFLGAEAVHLRAWLPSNLRAFIAAVEYHYPIPEFVKRSGDPRLIGVLDGIVEAYTGERGFMGVHRYKVFGLLEVAAKTGRSETNGNSGTTAVVARPWEQVHHEFSLSMKERLEPYRGNLQVQPHEMRGTFEECRYRSKIIRRDFVDNDCQRSIARVILDIHNTGITFQPGDRLAIMPLNSWMECAKVAAALGLTPMIDVPVALDSVWSRFATNLSAMSNGRPRQLNVKDILRRGHLAPLTKDLVMKLHAILRASSNTVLQVLATNEWPVRATLGDLLQAAVRDTPTRIWDQAFDLSGNLSWLSDLVPIEVPRTYSISNYSLEFLPSTVELTIGRSEYELSSTFSGEERVIRNGVSSCFLNPHITEGHDLVSDDEELLVGISRPFAFQLPVDDAAPCAFFAGGSGIAPFRSFWQARAGRSIGKNILYLGVQSREKFCYESELREYVHDGSMEVHTAFSRDSRGLVYDASLRDLVERDIPPRYIDMLIVEQGQTVCDLVMSKKQGGLGGYLYVCGSTSVFDSVMSGIRKAIYNHRTATMESTQVILDQAFAERRFMLDVFMTPKPLPCNIPTIPLSQLALNTAHKAGVPLWIAVHGSVYDVTDFCFMHPGGTNIIKSNAGVDCSKTFDLLAHTNNPEVSSILNKYFVGHQTPKPGYLHSEEISMLYDLWADYLRTVVETLVAQHFEMDMIMNSANVWFQGNLFNMGGVRRFYQYQSRLLQGGFSALFGAKLQELYLKLSFTFANAATLPGQNRLPDILGIIARAKTSKEAITTTNEVSQIGQFTCNSEAARFHEKGIVAYAGKSVELDMNLLESIRDEACRGMNAFDSLMDLDAQSEPHRITALSAFLMQILERMANHLESFYYKLAEHSVFHPELERNPARSRWNLLRRRVHDGSFFLLTHQAALGADSSPTRSKNQIPIGFDRVISQIQQNLSPVSAPNPLITSQNQGLTDRHVARSQPTPHSNEATGYSSHQNGIALNRISRFMSSNIKAIRRLSKMPLGEDVKLDQLMRMYGPPKPYAAPVVLHQRTGPTTPPGSRSSSRSPEMGRMPDVTSNPLQIHGLVTRGNAAHPPCASLKRRDTASSTGSLPRTSSGDAHGYSHSQTYPAALPPLVHPHAPSPPLSASEVMASMVSKLNLRDKSNSANRLPSPPESVNGDARSVRSLRDMSPGAVSWGHRGAGSHSVDGAHERARSRSGSSLRTFRLGRGAGSQGGSGRRDGIVVRATF